ncbi:protein of unknown function (plasmid) [Rhodovastum atsumiense]|uniref:hypothetical protein n=1 Tax=Rhodovastum atsumiense TaxID=504468 RepID=UPI00202462D3|nr:hypothetical protein [Rhodovastum atsumiense]CAH2605506.1 protein of unknown function [Rhodovastum atsumiense]
MSAGTAADDPVREVTGLPALEILERCRRIRQTRAAGASLRSSPSVSPAESPSVPVAHEGWRMVDFGRGTNADFVQAVHLALLGRTPAETEAARRIRELRLGMTRMEIILRVALSPEGRRTAPLHLTGVLLPVLVWFARQIDRATRIRGVGYTLHVLFNRRDGAIVRLWRAVRRSIELIFALPLIGSILELATGLLRVGRMRRELADLREELQRLKGERSR